MWTMFFTVPIMTYIVKGEENMNGGLFFVCNGDIELWQNPPPPRPALVDLVHKNFFVVDNFTKGRYVYIFEMD